MVIIAVGKDSNYVIYKEGLDMELPDKEDTHQMSIRIDWLDIVFQDPLGINERINTSLSSPNV